MAQMTSIPPVQAINETARKDDFPADHEGPTKTLYQVSSGSIFWRNFVAGFARALGGLLIWVILVIISSQLFLIYVWPQMRPLLTSYQKAIDSITTLGNSGQNVQSSGEGQTIQIDPATMQNIIQQLNKSK
jgi:hypothetical protein